MKQEKDLAAFVVTWLTDAGYEVFQEVARSGHTADIVARKEGDLVVIETKMSLSLDVIAQARRWLPSANQVYVAVPRRKVHTGGYALALKVLAWLGIGLIEVTEAKFQPVHITVAPTRKDGSGGKWTLVDAQKTFCAAGSKSGAWTPFKQTCIDLTAYVEANPGKSLKEAVHAIGHHYKTNSSAVSSLQKMIQKGVLKTVAFRDGGLYLP